MDEYFALNAIFVGIMIFYFHKMYELVGKMVSVMEVEFQKTHYTLQNQPPIEMPTIEIPPPPPPIPDEWFERMEEHLSKVPEIDLSDIERKIKKNVSESMENYNFNDTEPELLEIEEKIEAGVPPHRINNINKFFIWDDNKKIWVRR